MKISLNQDQITTEEDIDKMLLQSDSGDVEDEKLLDDLESFMATEDTDFSNQSDAPDLADAMKDPDEEPTPKTEIKAEKVEVNKNVKVEKKKEKKKKEKPIKEKKDKKEKTKDKKNTAENTSKAAAERKRKIRFKKENRIKRLKKAKNNIFFMIFFFGFVALLVWLVSSFVPKDNPVSRMVDNIKERNAGARDQHLNDISTAIIDKTIEIISSPDYAGKTEFSNEDSDVILARLVDEVYPKYSQYISIYDFEVMVLNMMDYCEIKDIGTLSENVYLYSDTNFAYDSMYKTLMKGKTTSDIWNFAQKMTNNTITENDLDSFVTLMQKNENITLEDINIMITDFAKNISVEDDTLQMFIYSIKDKYDIKYLPMVNEKLKEIGFTTDNFMPINGQVLTVNTSFIQKLIDVEDLTSNEVDDLYWVVSHYPELKMSYVEDIISSNTVNTIFMVRDDADESSSYHEETVYNEDEQTIIINKKEWGE